MLLLSPVLNAAKLIEILLRYLFSLICLPISASISFWPQLSVSFDFMTVDIECKELKFRFKKPACNNPFLKGDFTITLITDAMQIFTN